MKYIKIFFILISLLLCLVHIPQVLAVEMDNSTAMFNFSNLTHFDYIKWINYYTGHFWFLIHIVLLVYVIVNFILSFSRGLWNRARREIKGKPFITELQIYNINKHYHLFAEIFLLIGLAGAALSVQSAITPDFFKITTDFEQHTSVKTNSEMDLPTVEKKHEKMAEAIKSGLAFSAAGIILAIFCYLLRSVEVWPYKNILLRERLQEKQEKRQEKLEFKNSLGDISKLYCLFEQFLSKQPIADSQSIITLSSVLEALDKTSTENIRKVMLIIQKSQTTFNEQLAEIKLLQSDFTKSSQSIQVFLDNMQSITDYLQKTQEAFKQNLLLQVEEFIQSHTSYLELNAENTKSVLRTNLEETNKMLIVTWEKQIEQIYQHLQKNLSQEHTLYIERLDKYQSLISEIESTADEQVQKALVALKEENKQIHDQMRESVEKLKAIIVSDFLEEVGEHSNKLAQAFNAYLDKSSQVCEINRINVEIVKDTMEKAGLSPKEKKSWIPWTN